MKLPANLFKVSLIAAFLCFILTLYFYFTGNYSATGPFLSVGLILLAIGLNGFEVTKSFSYTFTIFAAVALAMYYPATFRTVGTFDLKGLIVPLLQIIMFGMGSQMSVKDFEGVVKMPKGVFVGIVCQFSIMPFVGFTIASLFNFPAEIAAGIILVGSSPSGLASNVMSFIAKANLALSVTLTAVATLLAPLMTPFLMGWLAGEFVPIDFWGMMLSIVKIVILPIVAGLLFNAVAYGQYSRSNLIKQGIVFLLIILLKNYVLFSTTEADVAAALNQLVVDITWFFILPIVGGLLFKRLAKGNVHVLDKALAFISMAGIAVIITIITAAGRDSLLEIGLLLILACLIHNSLGYFLGYWGCKLLKMDERSCRTIALEVGMQNGGLASGIALEMGKVATVGLAPAVFGPMMNITGSSLANWWRNKVNGTNDTRKNEENDE